MQVIRANYVAIWVGLVGIAMFLGIVIQSETVHSEDLPAFAPASHSGNTQVRSASAEAHAESSAALSISKRIAANEQAAIAILKRMTFSQALFQSRSVVDTDGDGRGEFGFLAELAGSAPLRAVDSAGQPALGHAHLSDPCLGPAFRKIETVGQRLSGAVRLGGYYFQMSLPGFDRDGEAVEICETERGGCPPWGPYPDPQRAEESWTCTAWPAQAGVTGQRAFSINETRRVLCSKNLNRFDGAQAPPPSTTKNTQANANGSMQWKPWSLQR